MKTLSIKCERNHFDQDSSSLKNATRFIVKMFDKGDPVGIIFLKGVNWKEKKNAR